MEPVRPIRFESLETAEILDLRVSNALLLAGVKPRSADLTSCDLISSALHNDDEYELVGCDCAFKVEAAVTLIFKVLAAATDYPNVAPSDAVRGAIAEAKTWADENLADRKRPRRRLKVAK